MVVAGVFLVVSTHSKGQSSELMQRLTQKNCMTCHAWDKKLVGPAYRDVRARYNASDIPRLTDKVLNGGSGIWGPVPMPANRPQVSYDEAKSLVTGILGASSSDYPSRSVSQADLMQRLTQKNCMTCHAWDKRLVGPAYRDVRARYNASDIPRLTEKVLNGGSGVWSTIPMPANRSQVSYEEAQSLVTGILGASSSDYSYRPVSQPDDPPSTGGVANLR